MKSDPWQLGAAGAVLAAVARFLRKGVKVSSLEVRVVDPKAEGEIKQLRIDLSAATEQLQSARVELATVRAELVGLHSMRSEFQEERDAWRAERAQLRSYVARLERDLVARRREDGRHDHGHGTEDGTQDG